MTTPVRQSGRSCRSSGGRSSTSAAGRDGSWPPPGRSAWAPWASTPVAKRSARRAAAVPAPSNSQFPPQYHVGPSAVVSSCSMATSASGEDITALLDRCRQLIAPSGTLLVEKEADDRDRHRLPGRARRRTRNRQRGILLGPDRHSGPGVRATQAARPSPPSRRLQGRDFCSLSPRPEPFRSSRKQGRQPVPPEPPRTSKWAA